MKSRFEEVSFEKKGEWSGVEWREIDEKTGRRKKEGRKMISKGRGGYLYDRV